MVKYRIIETAERRFTMELGLVYQARPILKLMPRGLTCLYSRNSPINNTNNRLVPHILNILHTHLIIPVHPQQLPQRPTHPTF